jgi:hypothetical protein
VIQCFVLCSIILRFRSATPNVNDDCILYIYYSESENEIKNRGIASGGQAIQYLC